MKHAGKLSIARSTSHQGDDIRIPIRDERSGVEFIEARMGVEDFGYAISGLSYRPITFEVRGLKLIGMTCEHKTVLVERVPSEVRPPDDAARAAFARGYLKEYEVDGLVGNASDLFNTHHWRKADKVEVSFWRYVDDNGTPVRLSEV